MLRYPATIRLPQFARSIGSLLCLATLATGHEQTLPKFLAARDRQVALAEQQAESVAEQESELPGATITLKLWDASGDQPLPGLVRITNLVSGKVIELAGPIHRKLNWYSVPHVSQLHVPQTKLRFEAIHGIETERAVQEIDLTDKPRATIKLHLPRIYDPGQQALVGGNTHLHLMKISYTSAIDYLKLVPRTDGLDVVFLSHLRRANDERGYISNLIVEQSLAGGELARLSDDDLLFGNGEEHRHNFDADNEGYGHVMLLNLKKLIRPVSIGPGIMHTGTDGIALQRGIREARQDGATVVWCHNHRGLEDLPNLAAGLLHALNIFDGSTSGSYEDSFYKYLNLGLKVPFSTGTDWFMYDFSRVYVPLRGELTTSNWLGQLVAGRSYITNGTFLELNCGDNQIGDRISLDAPAVLTIAGRAIGRNKFDRLELISNGKVIHQVDSRSAQNHYEATLQFDLQITEPGWFAIRIPRKGGKNELGNELFAHTSPIYVELAGQRIFRPDVARRLIAEIEQNMLKIRSLGVFGAGEETTVLNVHRQAIVAIEQLMQNVEQ